MLNSYDNDKSIDPAKSTKLNDQLTLAKSTREKPSVAGQLDALKTELKPSGTRRKSAQERQHRHKLDLLTLKNCDEAQSEYARVQTSLCSVEWC